MYEHYIAIDWAKSNMAIARMTSKSRKINVVDVPSSLEEVQIYLKSLRGRKILTIEETTTAHWLYVELRPLVDELIVCDPYRNKLLSEGAKDDKIDAVKLVRLLKADMLKAVFHSNGALIELRKLKSSYQDLIQRGVRLKNQRNALLRAKGKEKSETFDGGDEHFIISRQDRAITEYERDRKEYEAKFLEHIKRNKMLKNLQSIPGIGTVGAIKIGSIVVSADRFSHKNKFHAYCGLVRLEKMSGGRSYGSRAPRANRELKSVFKTAALVATQNNNCFGEYYEYMCTKRRLSNDKARHAVARLVATAALAVMRSGKKFNPDNLGALKNLT